MLTPYWSFHLQMFPPIPMAIFLFFHGFLCCVKALSLIQSFVYFSFYFFCLRRDSQKNLAVIYVRKCSAYRSSMVSGLPFGPLIHFEFIFVYGVRKCYNIILLHVAFQFIRHHLLKRLSFLHWIFQPPLA